MRLALPDFLMSTFKILENEGYRITQRRPGTKRSIKFQDSNRSLVMDVKLPSSSWVRITPEDVHSAVSGRRRERIPAVAEILQIGGQPLPQRVNVPASPARAASSAPFHAPGQPSEGATSPSGSGFAPDRADPAPVQQPMEDFDADMTGDDIAGGQF